MIKPVNRITVTANIMINPTEIETASSFPGRFLDFINHHGTETGMVIFTTALLVESNTVAFRT